MRMRKWLSAARLHALELIDACSQFLSLPLQFRELRTDTARQQSAMRVRAVRPSVQMRDVETVPKLARSLVFRQSGDR